MRKKHIRIIHFNELDSTNIYAKEHHQLLPSGTVITADTQLSGKGQFGRIWCSPKGNIYSTLIYKAKENFEYPQFLSQIVGLAIYLFISSIILIDLAIASLSKATLIFLILLYTRDSINFLDKDVPKRGMALFLTAIASKQPSTRVIG